MTRSKIDYDLVRRAAESFFDHPVQMTNDHLTRTELRWLENHCYVKSTLRKNSDSGQFKRSWEATSKLKR